MAGAAVAAAGGALDGRGGLTTGGLGVLSSESMTTGADLALALVLAFGLALVLAFGLALGFSFPAGFGVPYVMKLIHILYETGDLK